MGKMTTGLVHIYCGNGKGKTTTGMGLCARAAGYGYKVLIYQFMKKKKRQQGLIDPKSRNKKQNKDNIKHGRAAKRRFMRHARFVYMQLNEQHIYQNRNFFEKTLCKR